MEKKFNFARLVFRNSDGMKKFSYLFDKPAGLVIHGLSTRLGAKYKPLKFKIFESNLAPMLRCFHIRKISGCSWISVNNFIKIKKAEKDLLLEMIQNVSS